jgi:GTP-binding protein EngB required for normal cell division
MERTNVGFFGVTSTGKSTMINTLLGRRAADTGLGGMTTKITPYKGTCFTLWDSPGQNETVLYFSMEYISFFKSLSRRLILIQRTVKENTFMMRLFDRIGLHYDIVVNKFDQVDQYDQAQFKRQIEYEIATLRLKGVRRLYFVSAMHPQMFNDWLVMVDDLTK